jgi:hypothetical protein
MFGNDHKSMKSTLAKMQAEALSKCNSNQVEAKDEVIEALARDRRFDQYNHQRLMERVQDAWGRGVQLDLDDPALMRVPPKNRYG